MSEVATAVCHYRIMTVVEAPAPSKLRLRRSGAIAVTAVVTFVIGSPLGMGLIIEQPVNPVLAPLAGIAIMVAPVVVSLWSWRSGVDVTEDGITIKGLLSSDTITWNRIMGFTTADRTVYALLDDNSRRALTPMREEHLPRVLQVGQQDVADASSPDTDAAKDST